MPPSKQSPPALTSTLHIQCWRKLGLMYWQFSCILAADFNPCPFTLSILETRKSLLWKDQSFVSCDKILNTKYSVHRSVLKVNKLCSCQVMVISFTITVYSQIYSTPFWCRITSILSVYWCASTEKRDVTCNERNSRDVTALKESHTRCACI
jgi:hypothetical protein